MMDSIYRPVVEKWAQRGTRIEKYMDDIALPQAPMKPITQKL